MACPCHHAAVAAGGALWFLLRGVMCFFTLVYAGKIFVWLYVVTQDSEVTWLSWDSFWHAPRELLIGVLGLTILAGCCVRNE